jgi:hypothetical protein
MKLPYKILLVNIGIALVLGLLTGGGFGGTDSFASGYGVVAFFGGIIDLLAGLILLVKTDRRYAQGFLLSAAFLMLTGFITCTTIL